MQTFLPYPSFTESARVLDYRRLGKQRVEAYQILRALTGESKGWINHPAVKMWRNYELSIADYGIVICTEWRKRGYRDTLLEKFKGYASRPFDDPEWLGNKIFHASHRSNLLRKDPIYYGQFKWEEPNNLPYIWPIEGE